MLFSFCLLSFSANSLETRSIILDSVKSFVIFVQVLLILYIIMKIFFRKNVYLQVLDDILSPILSPLRYMVKHSIFKRTVLDISPIIAQIIVVFIIQFLSTFM